MNPESQAVSGGIGGFLAFFLLACALWLLMRNMNSRLQNVKYREELEQERAALEADRDVVSRPRGLGLLGRPPAGGPEAEAGPDPDEVRDRVDPGGEADDHVSGARGGGRADPRRPLSGRR